MQKVWQSMPITLKGGGCTVDLVFPGSSPTSQQRFFFFLWDAFGLTPKLRRRGLPPCPAERILSCQSLIG